jgi:hypothetical protein
VRADLRDASIATPLDEVQRARQAGGRQMIFNVACVGGSRVLHEVSKHPEAQNRIIVLAFELHSPRDSGPACLSAPPDVPLAPLPARRDAVRRPPDAAFAK